MSYKDKIWKKSWDSYVKDLDPKEFDMTYPQAIRRTMEDFPEKIKQSQPKSLGTLGDLLSAKMAEKK